MGGQSKNDYAKDRDKSSNTIGVNKKSQSSEASLIVPTNQSRLAMASTTTFEGVAQLNAGFNSAGQPVRPCRSALKRAGLDALALQRPERLGHLQHMIRRGRIEMVGKKPVNLRGAEATCASNIKLMVDDDGVLTARQS